MGDNAINVNGLACRSVNFNGAGIQKVVVGPASQTSDPQWENIFGTVVWTYDFRPELNLGSEKTTGLFNFYGFQWVANTPNKFVPVPPVGFYRPGDQLVNGHRLLGIGYYVAVQFGTRNDDFTQPVTYQMCIEGNVAGLNIFSAFTDWNKSKFEVETGTGIGTPINFFRTSATNPAGVYFPAYNLTLFVWNMGILGALPFSYQFGLDVWYNIFP